MGIDTTEYSGVDDIQKELRNSKSKITSGGLARMYNAEGFFHNDMGALNIFH